MRTGWRAIPWRRLALLAAGTTFFLGGCDAQTKAAIETGLINAASGLLTAIMQAIVQLAGEQAAQQTTQVFIDAAARVVA